VVVLLLVGLGLSDDLSFDAHPVELDGVVLQAVDGSSGSRIAAEVEETGSVGLVFGLGEPSSLDGLVTLEDGVNIFLSVDELDGFDSVGNSEKILDVFGILVGRDIEDSEDLVEEVSGGDELLLEALDEVANLLVLGLLAELSVFLEELDGLSSLALLMHDSSKVLDGAVKSFLVLESENVVLLGLGKILFILFGMLGDVVVIGGLLAVGGDSVEVEAHLGLGKGSHLGS